MRSRLTRTAALLATLLCAAPAAAMADDGTAAASTPAPTPNDNAGYGNSIGEYFANWFARSDAAKASQPHWMTPLVTVTPRLEQEVRYDQYWQHLGNGANIDQYFSGKGLELIPTNTEEVLINPPAYLDRSVKAPAQGWGDDPFLVVKQRLLTANEQEGNYIVTAFLGLQAPTGIKAFTANSWLITPTIAAGKGWGDFDVQSTFSVAIPTEYANLLGTQLIWNTAFQYHFAKYFWPELETNLTHWDGGLRAGKTQLFLTPGLILGRFPLYDRFNFVIGAGYQFAVSPALTEKPVLTPLYNHAFLITVRTPF